MSAASRGPKGSANRPITLRPKAAGARPAKKDPVKEAPAGKPDPRASRPRPPRPDAQRPAPRRHRRRARLQLGRPTVRIRALLVVFGVLLSGIAVRGFMLQALDSQAYASTAAERMQRTVELEAARGAIVDRNGVVLAETEPAMVVSIDPYMINTNGADERYPMSENKQEEAKAAPHAVAEILAKHLGGRPETYLELISKKFRDDGKTKNQYELVKRAVPAHTYTQLQADMKAGIDGDGERPWYGVFGDPDPIRVYPNRSVASNVVGFINAEREGAAGLEYALNDKLTGVPGKATYERSTYGRIPLGTNELIPPQDGASFQLTLDSQMNWFAEQALAEGVAKAGASTGMLVMLNVNTSEVLALANYPSYDAADPGAADTDDLGNRVVTEAYEPGSVQKVLTMAALADQGLVEPDLAVDVPARIPSGSGYVRDSFSHGHIKLTARGVIAQSSNIGTINLARQMPKAQLSEYLSSFGLGAKTGLGLPGETTGSLPGPDMADYTRDQISFGQGLSVNAIQMAAAVGAVANGGTYIQPTIIKSATEADGTPIELPEPKTHRVVSEEASAATLNMMEAVISEMGNGSRKIDGYRTAGKSGTAQRYDPDCKCYNGFTSSFVGVAPAEDPQILVYVVLDQPKNGNLGSKLALPVVNNVLKFALPRYNVLPSTTEPPGGALEADE
ncbi:peptidoglycan D,D-transpeptidase FtsI family protein [Tessaracoccus caeni]|uniref:peptidoglycan D,D-transpeptidase FtsI family protein n=1 Tax=Tessaracoccus caeni TaxID=3031239 RepID=UPI0023DC526C|nr:penicillin-binding protein 2 [Tessaracoccus caeni]MDF1487909.1 penicillin-binding protein 2 [Tessaracoccus caeni]